MNRLVNKARLFGTQSTLFTRKFRVRRRFSPLVLLTVSVLLAAGCAAGRQSYRRGIEAELSRNYDEALTHYEDALAQAPGDIEYRLKAEQARFAAAFHHFENGRRALDAGDLGTAQIEFRRAIQLDGTHDLARRELERAEALMRSGTAAPGEENEEFEVRKELARTDPSVDLQLSPEMAGPITLISTQEAEAIYEFIGDVSGLNIIFDPDFRSTPISVNFNGLSVYEVLDLLGLQTRTFWTPINRKTIIVSPDNQQKRREYERHILKTIYFTNSVNPTDITEAITAIRTLLNVRFIAQSTSMNAIIIRDTPVRVAIAEKIVEDIDKSKPEVLVEATVLEVDRNRLRELGILPPQGTGIGLGSGAAGSDGGSGEQVALRDLNNLNSGSFNIVIPGAIADFLESDTHTRMVQNPSVRATDGQLATIRIGSRVPVASGSFQPVFGTSGGTPVVQFQYIDVGVNMDITPRVLLNREISMQVVVQVQATAGNNIISGVALPVFTNREVTHEIRLSEGETNILGGLITDTESTATSGIPGLSRIPILGHLFSSESRQRDQTEIIVLLTPHIVKMPRLDERNLRGLMVGPEMKEQYLGLAGLSAEAISSVTDPIPAEPIDDPVDLPAGTDTIGFDQPSVTLPSGMPVQIGILTDTTGMSRADFTLEFDPSMVSLLEVRDGGFFSQDGSSVALVQNIDTLRGRVEISVERPDRASPVSGSGRILTLMLEGIEPGTSQLRISNLQTSTEGEPPRSAPSAQIQITVP